MKSVDSSNFTSSRLLCMNIYINIILYIIILEIGVSKSEFQISIYIFYY